LRHLQRALGSTGYFCYGSLVSVSLLFYRLGSSADSLHLQSAIILILPGWFICLGALELGSRNIVSGAMYVDPFFCAASCTHFCLSYIADPSGQLFILSSSHSRSLSAVRYTIPSVRHNHLRRLRPPRDPLCRPLSFKDRSVRTILRLITSSRMVGPDLRRYRKHQADISIQARSHS
jgi:hypothetical protein